MRDWLVFLAPVAAMILVALYPEQSEAVAGWVIGLMAGMVGR